MPRCTYDDKGGRRREVVELYNSHVHVLEQELHSLPRGKRKWRTRR